MNRYDCFGMLLIYAACACGAPAKFISTVTAPDNKEEYTIVTYKVPDATSPCNYVKASVKGKKANATEFNIDFDCHNIPSVFMSKSVFDAKGNYITTYHAVTDEAGNFLGQPLIPALQVVLRRRGIVPVTSEELSLLDKINAELKTKHTNQLPEGTVSKIIGWVASE